jgi:hypothetical protein
MIMARALVPVIAMLALAACGGDKPAPAPPGTPAASTAAKAAAQRAPQQKPVDTATVTTSDSTQLQREVFSYRGAGRDPFLSLMKSASDRPLVGDLRVTGITYDPAYPARSVAILRDTAQHKRFAVRTGDELGRMKVTEIRDNAIVVTLDEFGVERQVVLPVRRGKQGEETP